LRRTALVLLSLVLSACARDPVAPLADLRLAVDRIDRTHLPDVAAAVGLTLEHRGGRAVALAGCSRPPYARVERLEGSSWEEVGSHGILCLAIHSVDAIAFAPGSRLGFEVLVPGPGTYRVRVLAGADPQYPEAVATSPHFTVP
jgi:hypothetical protein